MWSLHSTAQHCLHPHCCSLFEKEILETCNRLKKMKHNFSKDNNFEDKRTNNAEWFMPFECMTSMVIHYFVFPLNIRRDDHQIRWENENAFSIHNRLISGKNIFVCFDRFNSKALQKCDNKVSSHFTTNLMIILVFSLIHTIIVRMQEVSNLKTCFLSVSKSLSQFSPIIHNS